MSRLSRKEVKRDEVLETVGKTVDYARDHSRTIVMVLAAAIALAIGYAAYTVWSGSRGMRANEALAGALEVLDAEVDPYDPKPDEDPPKFASEAARNARAKESLETVVRRHGGSRPAEVAKAYLAGLAAREGDADRARELWREVAGDSSDHLLASQARVNMMALDREQGRGRELADRLRAELDAPDASLPKPVLLHQLALTLESLGLPEEAREVYERLADEHPSSVYAGDARRRADLL